MKMIDDYVTQCLTDKQVLASTTGVKSNSGPSTDRLCNMIKRNMK